MKTIKTIILGLLLFLTFIYSQAQVIPKPPQPKIYPNNRVHREAQARLRNMGENEKNKALEKQKKKGFKAIDDGMHKSLPKSYDFQWTYTLEFQSKKNTSIMSYFLQPNAPYTAFEIKDKKKPNQNNGLLIIDTQRNRTVILMDTPLQKFLVTTKIPALKNPNDKSDNKYIITKIGTKTILGHLCQGYKISNEDGIAITYVFENAPVNFNQFKNVKSKKNPKGFNTTWLKQFKNGLIMEMDYKSAKNKKYNSKIKCTSLKKEERNVNISEYHFLKG